MVQPEIGAADGGTQEPGIVPVGETEVQARFAGDRRLHSLIEGGQVERLDGPQGMAGRADSGGIHLGQAGQQIYPAHGVPKHLVHAEGLRVPLLEAGHGLQEVAGILPQEAAWAKGHQAAASQLQSDLLLLGAVDPRYQVDGETAGLVQHHHPRPPVPPRGRRRRQQVTLHPNPGLGVVANQLPHQGSVQLLFLQNLHLQRRPVGRHGAQEPHPVPPDPAAFGFPLSPGADGGSPRTDQQGRQFRSLRRQPGGRSLHLIQPRHLPVPGAARLRRPGQSGQHRRRGRHKPPPRNPAGRPARCLSSLHSRVSLVAYNNIARSRMLRLESDAQMPPPPGSAGVPPAQGLPQLRLSRPLR